ncbi:MAG TPA: hypothetical protein VK631_27665 [Solirubrobacteraceae bacterium]|nr:hypothetical protein [Solirubrobacteraceae bacterium]
MPHLSLATIAVAAALALGACGDEPVAPEDRPPVDVEDQLGFDQAGILARQSRVETAIRDCMRAEGFEYVPVDPLARRAAVLGSSRLSEEEFLEQFGYGISTLWGRGRADADPNERLRMAMAPADRRAYDRVLWGENPGATFTAAVDSGDFDELGGCTRKATEAVFGGAQVLTQLQGKLDALEERVLQDQRMVRAIESWSECIAAAGYRYEEPEAIDSDLFERMEEIVGPLPGQFATGPPADEEPQPYNRAKLADLQHEEVAIAKADHGCELEHITPVEEKVTPQYSDDFLRQNESLISRVKPAP